MSTHDRGTNSTDAAALKRAEAREAEAAAGLQGRLVGFVFAGTFLCIAAVMVLGSRPAEISLTPTTFGVRAAGYSAEIARNRIDSVRLTPNITGLGSRLNGFQAGNAYAGLFAMKPFGKARLFVNASRPPYVMIYSRDGVVMVNGDSPEATQRLFAELDAPRSTTGVP